LGLGPWAFAFAFSKPLMAGPKPKTQGQRPKP
jgi:hypothetical protein